MKWFIPIILALIWINLLCKIIINDCVRISDEYKIKMILYLRICAEIPELKLWRNRLLIKSSRLCFYTALYPIQASLFPLNNFVCECVGSWDRRTAKETDNVRVHSAPRLPIRYVLHGFSCVYSSTSTQHRLQSTAVLYYTVPPRSDGPRLKNIKPQDSRDWFATV